MVLKSLRGLIKNETALFIIMLICIFSSSLILYFAYGLYQNYNVKLTESNEEYKELSLDVNEGQTLTKRDLCTFIEALPVETTNNAEIFLVSARIGSIASHRDVDSTLKEEITERFGEHVMTDDLGNELTFDENTDISDWDGAQFTFRFRYIDGKYKFIDIPKQALNDGRTLASGRFYSDDEYNSGADVVVSFNPVDHYTAELLYDGDKVILWGRSFEVIGTAGGNSAPTPPITAVPDELVLDPYFRVFLKIALTKEQYQSFKDTADRILPGMFHFEDISFPDSESIYVYNNIIIISVLIAVMSGINFVMLYRSILKRRSRTYAILRLCGCSRQRTVLSCIAEGLIIGVPTFLSALALYIPLMKYKLDDIFPYMAASYSLKVYAGIFLIYLTVMLFMLIVMCTVSSNDSIKAQLKYKR